MREMESIYFQVKECNFPGKGWPMPNPNQAAKPLYKNERVLVYCLMSNSAHLLCDTQPLYAHVYML